MEPSEEEYFLEYELYKLTEPLDGIDDIDQAIPHIFGFFEAYPDEEHGVPCALVHLLERFPGRYESGLKQSLSRTPSAHTLWMANRILNSPLSNDDRRGWLELIRSALTNPKSTKTTVDQANHFLEYQGGKG